MAIYIDWISKNVELVQSFIDEKFDELKVKYKKETKLINYLQDLLLSSQRIEREGIQIVIDREPLKFN